MNSFYWFDYETWGISPQWDKPAQFAGVRTDEDLNIVGTPDMFYCRLPPDYLPDPEACLVTGLQPDFVNQQGLSEPEFIAEVLKRFSTPKTCSVGYNSIRFDDEVTRYTCFRNFHDPYRFHWADGNSRWDLLDVVRLTRALRPEGIVWPENDDGSGSNKLEHLTAANGLEHAQAHDALSDVYATIAMAKLIKEAQPKLYQYALSLRNKQSVASVLNYVKQEPVVHVSGMVPMSLSHASIIVPLMPHPTNNNGVVVLDMRTDPESLMGLSADEIRGRVFDKTSDPERRIHLRTLQINRCPMVAPISVLREEDAQRIGLDRTAELERATRVSALTEDQLSAIGEAMIHQENEHSQRRNDAIARCPEAGLYSGGFFSGQDRKRADDITQSNPNQLIGFLETKGFFDDQRLGNLLINYRARYALPTLTEDERYAWLEDCTERLIEDGDIPWRTFAEFDALMLEAEGRWPDNAHAGDSDKSLKQSLLDWRAVVAAYVSD